MKERVRMREKERKIKSQMPKKYKKRMWKKKAENEEAAIHWKSIEKYIFMVYIFTIQFDLVAYRAQIDSYR